MLPASLVCDSDVLSMAVACVCASDVVDVVVVVLLGDI